MNRGDPSRHLDADAVERHLTTLPRPPADRGTVALLVVRGPEESRAEPARVALGVGAPLPGDKWSAVKDPDHDSQITAMEAEAGRRLANGQPLALFGDNLVLDLDLSARNLPPGSLVRVGTALLEVTSKPHTGCKKYAARFGTAALAGISRPDRKPLRLRGLHFRVRAPGVVAVGDAVEVVERPPVLPFG